MIRSLRVVLAIGLALPVTSIATAQEAENEPAENEPAQNEPAQNEPAENEPAQNEAAQNEAAQNEPAQSEPADSEGGEGEPDARQETPARDGEAASEEEEEGLTFGARLGGEYQHRFVLLSDVPLEPLPRTDPAATGVLGQNAWGEQWLRLHGELTLRPILRLAGELDLLWGVAYGDLAQGTHPAAWARDEYGYPGLRLRQLYLEWLTPIGLLRVGQMAFSWGLGMVANGGTQPPIFGDYRYGDLVRRVLFATKPAGEESPFTLAIAGDWVAWDLIADFERRGDLAFQGLLAALYEQGEDRIGAYVAYRHQQNPLGDSLEVFIGDLFAQLHFPEPSGGRIYAAFELAYIRGTTSYTRTVEFPTQDVEQLMAAVQLGRKEANVDVIFEGGYASGDSNTEDGMQRRATMDPDHRIGLILFPEVLAAQSARAAFLAGSPELFGRPGRGSELLPTNGGVSGAYYLFPYVVWRPLEWIDARLGAVMALSSTDVVDPFVQRARSRSVNYRGGDPTRRDLGLELDAAILLHGPIGEGVTLNGGVEGGVLLPGHAFDDADGRKMDPIGMLRLRLGIRY